VRQGLPHPPDHIWLVDLPDEPTTLPITNELDELRDEIGNRYLPFPGEGQFRERGVRWLRLVREADFVTSMA
jgi:hypothetical protein